VPLNVPAAFPLIGIREGSGGCPIAHDRQAPCQSEENQMWQKRRPKVILDIEAGQTGLSTRKLILESFGYNVLAAASGNEALLLIKNHEIHAVLLDESANDIPMQSLTSELKASLAVPIILVGDSSYVPNHLRHSVDCAVEKLEDPQQVVNALDRVLGINVPPATGEAVDHTENG
jgi:CheY-like chemotaxis protein